MEIKIRDREYWSKNAQFSAFMNANAGKWVPVETENLFKDKYNCERFRVMDCDVVGVRKDARRGRGRCGWCGKVSETVRWQKSKDVTCPHCGMGFVIPFSSAFFVKHADPVTGEVSWHDWVLPESSGLYRIKNWTIGLSGDDATRLQLCGPRGTHYVTAVEASPYPRIYEVTSIGYKLAKGDATGIPGYVMSELVKILKGQAGRK